MEYHVLGLVARLVEPVNDIRADQALSEKKRCIRAVEEMVKIGKTFTRAARPQVRLQLETATLVKKCLRPDL